MKLFGFEFGNTKAQEPQPEIKRDVSSFDLFTFHKANSYLPETSVYSYTSSYVKWGFDNLFPLQLVDLYDSSSTHASIVQQKAKMIIGEGVKYNAELLSLKDKEEFKRFIQLADGERDVDSVFYDLSFDYQLFGAICLEVIWNSDFTRIVRINRIPTLNIRLGKENDKGKVEEYYYSKDWRRSNSYTKIPSFNILNKTSQNQLIYIKNPSVDGRYYGVPTYSSGLNWIAADAAISKFHLSNISNGFSPSIAIKFYQLPESEEKRDKIVSDIKREYAGQGNAGKAMIFFSDGKDTAPDVETVQVSELDKQFTTVADQITTNVIRSHRGVSPILWTVKTAGQLGGASGEYEVAYKTFEKNVVQPDRKVIEKLLNRILMINGWNVNATFKPSEPLKDENTSTTGNSPNASPQATDVEAQAKANLKGSVGGVQGILEIQASVSAGITDYTAALAILDLIYGISEVDAKRILGTPKSAPQTQS